MNSARSQPVRRILLLAVILVLLASTARSLPARAASGSGQGSPASSYYVWWLTRWDTNEVVCTVYIQHPGAPTSEEVESHCGTFLRLAWKNTPACNAKDPRKCQGLYLTLASSPGLETVTVTPTTSPLTVTAAASNPAVTGSPTPATQATPTSPSIRKVHWLSHLYSTDQLAFNRPLYFLAGRLITNKIADASSCPNNGLQANSAATNCGLEQARYEVYLWQNRFDSQILEASKKTEVPPYLLKGVFAVETQFWPLTSYNNAWEFREFGLGQLNELGADTLLAWNGSFYKSLCHYAFNNETCEKDYISLAPDQRALLRGVAINLVRADCPTCTYNIDMARAESSVLVFAEVLDANRRQVKQVITNATGWYSSIGLNREDLWKFTLVNYHAGPGCLYSALAATQRAGEKITWSHVSKRLEPGCQGAIDYVEAISNVEVSDPPSTPTPFPTATLLPLTATETPTISPTAAATSTGTPAPNETITPTPTVTGTLPTNTPTATPGLEETATPTVTGTLPADTSTGTPPTGTPTATPGLEETATPTVTASPTATPIVVNEGGVTYLGDQVLVKFTQNYPQADVVAFAQSANARVVDHLEAMNIWTFEVPAGQVEATISLLRTSSSVEFAEPVYIAQTYFAPDDPDWSSQPYMVNIQMPQAWDITTGSEIVIVAVIDSGVDTTHPELAPALWTNPGESGLDGAGNDKSANGIDDDGNGYVDDWQGWNTVSASNNVSDDNGHGTHVAGIIAAQGNNAEGVAGMAWNTLILPIKAVDQNGVGTYMQVAEGIVYATDQGAHIINLSLGSEAYSWTLNYAVNYALQNGVLVIAATGDSGAAGFNYPAAFPGVLGVGSTDTSNQLASFSTTGDVVDLVAPGVNIYSTFPGGAYTPMSGTSMSAAHVSGAAALLASQPQFTTSEQIQEALFTAALDLGVPGPDSQFGRGLLQVYSALTYVPGQPIVTSTPFPSPTPGPTPTEDPGGTVVILADAANAVITNYTRACNVNAANYPNAALGGTGVVAIQNNNEVQAGPFDIGFEFWYMGTRYTQVYVSPNGWLSLNNGNNGFNANDLDNSGGANTAGRPFLAPLWDDLGGTGGTASYLTQGTAPNRTFTFEWWNWRWGEGAAGAVVSFRVILHENTGIVDFVYRQNATAVNNGSASIGLTGTANTSFLSASAVNNCPPTWSSVAEATNLNTRPATGALYSFTPPQNPNAPTGLNFTSITDTAMTLNWTDASANENGFVIYRSTDGVNFAFNGQTAADIATYNASGLTANTLYYWRVYSVTEGALSAALTGQQTTNAPPTVSITAPANNSTFVQGTSVTFTGTATDAIDGDLGASLVWTSSIDGDLGTGATFSTSTLSAGVHTITASATDSGGLIGTATITVTITDSSGNTPPTIVISMPVNNSTFVQGTNITFSGTANDVQDGDISANIQWSSNINGNLGTGASVSTSTLALGVHIITASATDPGGLTGQATIRVYISDAAGNVPPEVLILSPSNGATFTQGATIIFIGSATIPTNGSISHLIQWFDGAAGIGTGASFGLNTLSVGTHTITARATDSGGRTSTASITITIVSVQSPHGNYGATTDKCAVCHRTHTSQSSPLIGSPLSSNDFCLSCHATGEHTVSTHSNIDWPGGVPSRTEPGTFDMLCIQCHEPHSSTNLYLIRPPDQPVPGDDIHSGVRIATSPVLKANVVFTSTTGVNSYDEVDTPENAATNADDLCVACHANNNNPGYPMVNHTGGLHNGGFNYIGQDCTSCHPHSLDSAASTRDGFMTGCRACHNTTQDRGAGTPRRQIVGASGGDFTRASHHVTGNDLVTDTDCLLCHEMTQHKLGQVRLFNQDNSSTVYALTYANNTQTDADRYESFCRSCHDSNGRAGDATPFSDNKLGIPLSSLWSTAQHNIIKLTFKGSCLDCHDNGHGSNKKKLLAPWNYGGPGSGTDLLNQEEGFCFQCHQTGSPTGTPVQAAFTSYTNTATRFFKHDVNATYNTHFSNEIFGTSFGGANRHIDCNDCHESHKDRAGSASAPTVKPPDGGASGVEPVFSGIGAPTRFNYLGQSANEYQVCMKCHSSYTATPSYTPDGWGCTAPCAARNYVADGLRKLTRTANNQTQDTRDLARAFNPANASFHPLMAVGTNTNMTAASFVAGWGINSRVFCTDCHTNAVTASGGLGPHGSSLLHILAGSAAGNTNYSTLSSTTRNGDPTVPNTEVCFKCHQYSVYVSGTSATNTRFRDGTTNLHYQHMTNGRYTATTCYTCHNSHGSNQLHLINFDTSVAVPQGGRTSEGAWTGGNPTTTGTCYVACHSKTHGAGDSYTP